MWQTIKEILKVIDYAIDPHTKNYLDNISNKDTEPLFIEKDENESRFSEKTYEEEKEEKRKLKKRK